MAARISATAPKMVSSSMLKLSRAVERAHHLVHGPYVRHRKAAAGEAQLFGEGSDGTVGIAVGARGPDHRRGVGVSSSIPIHHLCGRNHHHGIGRMAEAVVVGVTHHANDGSRRLVRLPPIPVPTWMCCPTGSSPAQYLLANA